MLYVVCRTVEVVMVSLLVVTLTARMLSTIIFETYLCNPNMYGLLHLIIIVTKEVLFS